MACELMRCRSSLRDTTRTCHTSHQVTRGCSTRQLASAAHHHDHTSSCNPGRHPQRAIPPCCPERQPTCHHAPGLIHPKMSDSKLDTHGSRHQSDVPESQVTSFSSHHQTKGSISHNIGFQCTHVTQGAGGQVEEEPLSVRLPKGGGGGVRHRTGPQAVHACCNATDNGCAPAPTPVGLHTTFRRITGTVNWRAATGPLPLCREDGVDQVSALRVHMRWTGGSWAQLPGECTGVMACCDARTCCTHPLVRKRSRASSRVR